MANKNAGCQTIGCEVESCRYQDIDGNMCKLSDISVMANRGCHSGDCDESMCGSYEHR